jgi:hypothetical protein
MVSRHGWSTKYLGKISSYARTARGFELVKRAGGWAGRQAAGRQVGRQAGRQTKFLDIQIPH